MYRLFSVQRIKMSLFRINPSTQKYIQLYLGYIFVGGEITTTITRKQAVGIGLHFANYFTAILHGRRRSLMSTNLFYKDKKSFCTENKSLVVIAGNYLNKFSHCFEFFFFFFKQILSPASDENFQTINMIILETMTQ